jgi:hypothetical protein
MHWKQNVIRCSVVMGGILSYLAQKVARSACQVLGCVPTTLCLPLPLPLLLPLLLLLLFRLFALGAVPLRAILFTIGTDFIRAAIVVCAAAAADGTAGTYDDSTNGARRIVVVVRPLAAGANGRSVISHCIWMLVRNASCCFSHYHPS